MRAAFRTLSPIVVLLATGLRLSPVAADEEPVEVLDDIEVVDTGSPSDTPTPSLTAVQIIGRNHAAAVHLPIGLLFALCLVEVLRLRKQRDALETCSGVLGVAAALSFLPAALTGLLRGSELFDGREPPHLFFEHRNLMIVALALLLGALVLRFAVKHRANRKLHLLYLALIAVAFALTAAGAHHGGMLVYGESFLPY